eukprot:scaffold97_cov261-Pinguiococcus_pyrenoidosus.AAC.9
MDGSPVHPRVQRLHALEDDPGVVRGNARSDVAQTARAELQDVGEGAERLRQVHAPSEAAVAVVRFREERVLAA